MRILGIDPGTATTGWAVIDTDGRLFRGQKIPKIIACGVISTKKDLSDSHRIEIIYDAICDIIKKEKPKKVAVEMLFFCKNITTAMTVSQSRGVVLLAVHKAKLPVFEFTPMQVKESICGYGRAEKKQVQEMVKIQLGLKQIPKPDDCADALAAAITHYLMTAGIMKI